MHVAFLSPALPATGESNGIVTYVRTMRDALIGLGHEVTVATGDAVEHSNGSIEKLPEPTRLQVWTERLRADDGSSPYVRAKVVNAYRAVSHCDLIEMEETYGWASLLPNVAIRLHGPHIFGRETVEKTRADQRREDAEARAIRTARAVSSPSQGLLEALEDHGITSRPGVVYPNPVALPQEQWSIERADPDQVLFVGRIDRRKGADIAVEAFAKAREKRPSLKLLMVGPGDPIDAPQGVEFMGNLPAARIADLRMGSALALSTARFETFSYSVAEAMALGMPVLSSRAFGPQDYITEYDDGRLVPIGNADFTASVMLEMLSNADKLSAMGEAARATVAKRMDPLMIAGKFLALAPGRHPAWDAAGEAARETRGEDIEVVGACAG